MDGRVRRWVESLTSSTNENTEGVSGNISVFLSISASDSPYQASSGECILADMSSGDINVLVPTSGSFCVSRKGEPNSLTIVGTVNGEVNPEILFDGSTASMSYITEWRYV